MDKVTVHPMPYMSVMSTVLVGANVKGKPNYMTAAWATVACMAPPMVCVALNKERYTVKGIQENGQLQPERAVRQAGCRGRSLRSRLPVQRKTSPTSSGRIMAR